MKRLLILLALVAVGCTPVIGEESSDPSVRVFHDTDRGVTCWLTHVYGGSSISCLPDGSFGQ